MSSPLSVLVHQQSTGLGPGKYLADIQDKATETWRNRGPEPDFAEQRDEKQLGKWGQLLVCP